MTVPVRPPIEESSAPQDVRRRLRDLTTISEISLKLTSELDLQALFDLISFYATVLLEAQKAMLLLLEEDSGALVVKTAYGYASNEDVLGRAVDGAVALQLATWEGNRFLLVPPGERAMFPFLDPTDEAAIVTPIPGRRGTIGALVVEGKVSGEDFRGYDGEILSLLVAQAGIAIENAEVHRNLDRLVLLRTRALEEERDRADRLLRNVLPDEIAEELKATGRVSPRRHESVTVMFTDFVGFTAHAEKTSPEELLRRIEACWRRFDDIVEKHGLEKLKTIGDAYMCAAGIPEPVPTHAEDCVSAALEMVDALALLRDEYERAGESLWDIRIGIHTGPVVAGVAGKRKFAYDVWGDTVNVAARLESSALPNRINVSADVQRLIRGRFECEPRGLVEVKGRGRMPMYLVRRART